VKETKMGDLNISECTREPSANATGVNVQSTGKFMAPMQTLPLWNMRTHDTHLVQLLHECATERNPITVDPLPSGVEDITNILQALSHEDASLIAKTEILSLDDIHYF
jgi:hypothetical protein